MKELSPSELLIKDTMYSYAEKGIITIPVNEKRPCIMNWNDIAPVIDETTGEPCPFLRIESWFEARTREITGLAILITKENPGLGCVDIDSNDPELVQRLIDNLPSQYNKYGRKGCSFFFQHDGGMANPITRFPMPANLGMVEIFTGNKYVVIPPSLHSFDGDTGEGHYYQWVNQGCTLEMLSGVDDLPSISTEQILAIPVLIGSPSAQVANKNLPKTIQYDTNGHADGRFNSIQGYLGSLVNKHKDSFSIGEIVEKILVFDATNFPKNSFFLYDYNKKHAEIKSGDPRELNATRFVASFMSSINKRETINFVEGASSPIDLDALTFRQFARVEQFEEVIPDFLPDYIPPFIRDMLVDMANSYGVSLQSTFFPFIGALAGCLQSKVIIRPLKNATFYQRPNLFVVLLAHSGSMKSDIIKTVMQRVYELQANLNKCNPRDLLERQYSLQERIENLSKSKKKASGNGEFEEVDKINLEIYKLQDELDGVLREIKPTRWVYEMATIQKMTLDHSRSSSIGLFHTCDEFSSYINMFNKKGNEEARQYFMKCYDGDKTHTVSTISRGDDIIDPCFASLLSTYQPDVLKTKIADVHNPHKTENDGFWQRPTFISMGKPTLNRSGRFDPRKYASEYSLFDQAFGMDFIEINVAEDAIETYEEARKLIEARAFKYYGRPVSGFLSKHQGKLSRYACIAQFLLNRGKVMITEISKEAIEYAMKWLSYEAEDILSQFQINETQSDITEQLRIVEMIKSRVLMDGQTASQWHQHAKGSFKSMDNFLRHLKTLQDRGYVMTIPLGTASTMIKVNPEVWR